jgi:2-deoxy-D-gluconate 3-dehydrogenase
VKLKGKIAIVVGGSQGAGHAYVLALAREGAQVVAAARTMGKAGEAGTLSGVVKDAEGEGFKVLGLTCDMEKEDDVRRLVDQVIAKFGRIDILVNAAGIYPRHDTLTMSLDDWDRTMRVNTRGPYLTMRAVAQHMIKQRSGSIINLTSLSGQHHPKRDSGAHLNLCVYGVSKAALDRLTTYFAEELRPYNIAVNSISPGAALTENWRKIDPEGYNATLKSGAGNPATPEGLGGPIVYLAQQSAETLSGQVLHTNTFRKSWAVNG